jgi:hypothetical protein
MANHIMVTALPPDCPTLPDGRVLMAALVGMEGNRFGSMFLNGIQVFCASGLWVQLQCSPQHGSP